MVECSGAAQLRECDMTTSVNGQLGDKHVQSIRSSAGASHKTFALGPYTYHGIQEVGLIPFVAETSGRSGPPPRAGCL
jgi:hypothetical protein